MKNILTSVFVLLFSIITYAQSAVLPAGGNATSGGRAISYSIGQVFTSVFTSSTHQLSSGVQQPSFSALLPLEILDFKGYITSDFNVQLEWETASEKNVSHFEVEKSHDGQSWITLHRIDAKGNNNSVISSYSCVDTNPFVGAGYYRLRVVDFDGTVEFSKVINFIFSKESSFVIGPNPFISKIHIRSLSENVNNLSYTLTNAEGQLLMQGTIVSSESAINTSDLKAGLYFFSLFENQHRIHSFKLVKI